MKDEVPDLKPRTKEFALRVVRMFSALPRTDEARVLGRQVLRSGTSVGANYREASRARSKAEFIAKNRRLPEGNRGNRILAGTLGGLRSSNLSKNGSSARRMSATHRHLHHHFQEGKIQPFIVHPLTFILVPSSFPIRSPRKLIEVALPLDAINKACAREKSIWHGHPSTLHLWWARRPQAARPSSLKQRAN